MIRLVLIVLAVALFGAWLFINDPLTRVLMQKEVTGCALPL